MQRQAPIKIDTRPALKLVGCLMILAGAVLYSATAKAQATATQPSTGTIAVPTYESAGLYWQSPGGTAGCEVKFRKSGATAWSQGLPLWYDSRDQQCRGSLVSLDANTEYQVEFNLPGQAASRGLVFRTWPNQRPVAKKVAVNGATGTTYNITEGGSASGYVVYEGSGATLDGNNSAQYNVTVNASYVIVRGLRLTGAKQDAIRISPNVTDVIIEDNEITNWGRTRDGKWGADMDSAIRAVCTTPSLVRVTIQRNNIHEPRYGANSWTDGHPAGPQAITFSHCGGNHVFRHNDVWSVAGKYFNDIFGGEDNFTKAGFPNADTDINGNKLSHGWDDGIEAEGANENVRIWGNYIDRTAIGVATTVTSVGPSYVFRNVWNRAQMYDGKVDTDDRQPFFKSGTDSTLGYGRRYFFHNTMLQATQSGAQYGLGGGYGMGGTGSAQLIQNTHSKNNIYHLWKPGKSAFYQTGSGNEMANDMYNGTAGDATIVGGINATPAYAAGSGWQSEAGGMYQLAAGSVGQGKAVAIANFNSGAADVGAHQSGTAAMKFGIAGSPGNSLGTTTTTTTPTTPTSYALAVAAVGSGTGTVGSSPSGINCGSSCNASFAAGATVTLTATPASGSLFAGWSGACSGTATCTVSMTGANTVTATFNSTSTGGTTGVTPSPSSLGGFSKAKTQTVTFTNKTAVKVTFISASMSSTRYQQTNTCGEVSPGASCTATITYYPTNGGADTGTYTLTSTAPNSPHKVALAANGNPQASANSLIPHFYNSVLGRDPDASGASFWEQEVNRVVAIGADANEAYYAMAMSFYGSEEYARRGRDDPGFIADLYATFFNRPADQPGLSFWASQIASGMPREVVLAAFMFSAEFRAFTTGVFGDTTVRSEINAAMDLYRGLLGRLPDSSGFLYTLQKLRAAQCQGGAAVAAQADALSGGFATSAEYANRQRTHNQFVGDLYNAVLRRGGDLAGVRYWIQQLASGAKTREQVRRDFMASPEFSGRMTQVAAQGCIA